jgi:hypothetical protein
LTHLDAVSPLKRSQRGFTSDRQDVQNVFVLLLSVILSEAKDLMAVANSILLETA